MAVVRRWLPIVAVVVTAGCLNATSPATPIDRELVLAPSQRAQVPGTDLSIRFEGVMGDSRCPADALCVLGGDAIVRIVVNDNSQYDLHTGNMQPVQHEEVTIALVQLQPYPFSGRTIEQSDYRATLRVTR